MPSAFEIVTQEAPSGAIVTETRARSPFHDHSDFLSPLFGVVDLALSS